MRRLVQVIVELERHTNTVQSLAFSPDGLHIASLSLDNALQRWDATTASRLGPPDDLDIRISCLRFPSAGIQLDNEIFLDVSQGRPQLLLSPTPTIAYSSPLYSGVCVDEHTRQLWCISYPHHKYRIPPEFGWTEVTTHQDKAAFALENGQLLIIDFTDVAKT